MFRRSALSAFCASNGAFEIAARRIAMPTQRTFTSTAQRNKDMVYFSKTSSTELDDILTEIRHKIILPAYLPDDQRRKIYSKKFEKRLQADPITIEIDGEVFKFRFRDPFSGTPATRRTLFRALELFSAPEDFANLRPLVEGLAIARRKLDLDTAVKIARVMGRKGHVYDVIELARGVRRTSYKLDQSETVNEILHHVQMKAVDAAWDPEETAKALRWAEIVVDLLEDEAHQPSKPRPGAPPLARDPMVLLAPLHLAAVLALKQGAEADPAVVEKVVKYATKIVLLWEEDKALRQTQSEESLRDSKEFNFLTLDNKFLKLAAPWLYGLNAAIEVLEAQGPAQAELVADLQKRRDNLVAETTTALETRKGYEGHRVWQKVFEGENAGESEQESGNENQGEAAEKSK